MKTVGLYVKEIKLKIFIFKRFDSVCKHIATILVLKISIKRKTTLKNLSAYKKKKINTKCPYIQGTSRSTRYFISVSWSFISREASESVSLLHEVSLFNFWLNGYTYESLLDKGQSSQLYLTPIGLPGKISQ